VDLRHVFDDLVRFETVLWGAIDQRLRRECGVTLAGVNAMLVIDATPLCRVHEVARALAITVGGTSQAIDRLEVAGWCLRQPNPDDRRSSILTLTDTGAAMLVSAGTVFDDELHRFFRAPLSATELAHFSAALRKIRRAGMDTDSGHSTSSG
jgi:DNA-binding MarR family transcriptional regulator